MKPLQIKVQDKSLKILWEDNSESKIKLANLRRNCPCAICASERDQEGDKYIPIYSGDQLSVKSIGMVGSYAISITWKDGHNTGLYLFDQLKKLS